MCRLSLRRSGLDILVAELSRLFILAIFFRWLLNHGPNHAELIFKYFIELGQQADDVILSHRIERFNTHLFGYPYEKVSILDIGMIIYLNAVKITTGWSVGPYLLLLILLTCSLVLVFINFNYVLLLARGYTFAYHGIFLLGFGAAPWTSDIAINYYRAIIGFGVQLLSMSIILTLGKSFLFETLAGVIIFDWSNIIVLMVSSLILLLLTNQIPSMLGGLVFASRNTTYRHELSDHV